MREELINSSEIQRIRELIAVIKSKYNVDLLSLGKDAIPIEVFATATSPLVAVVNYLRSKNNDTKHIASILNRSVKTIYQCKKENVSLAGNSDITIPQKILGQRDLSIMEQVVYYLHTEKEMRFTTIAKCVNKDPRTVWTWWSRAKKKKEA